jgi:hypothetical protein
LTYRKTLVLSLFLGTIAVGQWAALRHSVLAVPSTDFGKATYLRSLYGWRIGFLRGQHGAWLVRTPSATFPAPSSAGPLSPLEPEMAEILSSLPRKALLEGILYAAALLSGALLLPAASRRVARTRLPALARHVIVGLFTVALGALILSPYLFLGYGGCAFTNWVGPGALSYSGVYLRLSPHPGDTVSYRNVVEVVAYPGLWLASYLNSSRAESETPQWVLVLTELIPRSLRDLPPLIPIVFMFLPFFVLGVGLSCALRGTGVQWGPSLLQTPR